MSEKIALLQIVDRLRILLTNARGIPLTQKVVIEKQQLSDLLKQLEQNMDPSLARAQQVLENEKQIIDTANATAAQTVNQANASAEEAVRQANITAKQTVEDANAQASATVTDANTRAADTVRLANDQANQTVASAQQQAAAMIAEATARARQMVDENEITLRAREEAEKLMDTTQRDCAEIKAKLTGGLKELFENADNQITQQLETLRALKQTIPE